MGVSIWFGVFGLHVSTERGLQAEWTEHPHVLRFGVLAAVR